VEFAELRVIFTHDGDVVKPGEQTHLLPRYFGPKATRNRSHPPESENFVLAEQLLGTMLNLA
ncbi:MAG TPA: hypothetical protein VGM72_12310, partial [Micropepsaceae bacterium]